MREHEQMLEEEVYPITNTVIDDDLDVEPDDGTELPDEEDALLEPDIDSTLVHRPQGRPKGTLDYKVPVHQVEGEYRKSVVVAAMVHLYYMQERQFSPDNVPLHHFQRLLDVSRHTIYRCLDDVKEGKVLALKLFTELTVISENLAQAESAKRRRQRQKLAESQARVMQRRVLERRIEREAKRERKRKKAEAPPVEKQPAKRRESALTSLATVGETGRQPISNGTGE